MTAERVSLLLRWLRQLHGMTGQLLVLLEQESECLEKRNLESLTAVVEYKNTVVAQIDQLTAQLPLETQLQEGTIERGLQSLSHPEADMLWQQIRDVIRRCRLLNDANGARIALLQEYNQQSLALLFGQRRQFVGYDPDGQSQLETGERWLGAG